MAERWKALPKDLLEHFRETLPRFNDLSAGDQMALARMVWTGCEKRRQHSYFDGYSSFYYQELADEFGAGRFRKVNEKVGIYETTRWSRDSKWTRGYKLTEQVKASLDAYFQRKYREPVGLLYGEGWKLATLPRAVASKDMDGVTTTAWRNAKELNKVRVDVESLVKLKNFLSQRREDLDLGRVQRTLFHSMEDPDRIQWALDLTNRVIRMARTSVAGVGYVAHHYVESASGRLYAKGINLQTVPTLIKGAALAGVWEYDFQNCHYSILTQMAGRFGIDCPAIKRYLSNKKTTREHIAKSAGIEVEQAKTCLIAIIYGARFSVFPDTAIPKEIGADAAQRLYAVPEFKSIKQDIVKARAGIIKSWPRQKNGWLANAFGKSIRGTESPEKVLAHLIQGVEAKALKAAIDAYPQDISLIQHDGFAANRKLEVKTLEHAVEEATGYCLTVEEERIQIDFNRFFG